MSKCGITRVEERGDGAGAESWTASWVKGLAGLKQSTDLSLLIIPLYHRLSLPNYNTAFWCAKLFYFRFTA